MAFKTEDQLATRRTGTSQPNFASLLDAAPTEVERPKPYPVGTYFCTVSAPEYGTTKNGDTSIRFTLTPYATDEDVDPEALEEMGGFNKSIYATFYEIESVIWRLDQFHKDCGIELSPKTSRRARNDLCMNCSVGVVLRHTQSQDKQSIFAEVSRSLPAEE